MNVLCKPAEIQPCNFVASNFFQSDLLLFSKGDHPYDVWFVHLSTIQPETLRKQWKYIFFSVANKHDLDSE